MFICIREGTYYEYLMIWERDNFTGVFMYISRMFN